MFFTRYDSPVMFPLAEGFQQGIEIRGPVIGAAVVDVVPVPELEDNVTIVFQLEDSVSW